MRRCYVEPTLWIELQARAHRCAYIQPKPPLRTAPDETARTDGPDCWKQPGDWRGYRTAPGKRGSGCCGELPNHPETAKQTVNEIRKMGRSAAAIQADISKVAEAQTLIAKSVEALGSLNTLVNNAGLEKAASFLETSESDYDPVLGVNLKSAFCATQAFAKHRLEVKQAGKVINISSVHEELTFPHFTAYCASKGG